MDLAAYRGSAETFVSELTAEYYRHYAGLKDDYAIEAIYDQHGALFTRGAVDSLRELAAVAPAGSEERRRLTMLADFAIEGHLGQATKGIEAELARREASLSIDVEGRRIGFRESAVVQANESDADRRAEIEQARLSATDAQLNPLYLELIERQHQTARDLGYPSYRELCVESKAVDLAGLDVQTRAFSASTEASYAAVVEPALQMTLGIGLDELRRSDLPRFFRAPEKDGHFPAPALVRSFIETAGGLGIEVAKQRGVILDIDPRPNKSPRAFCAPVRVPDEVYLVLAPVGGGDDYSVLFHEGGHTEHYAHIAPGLPFEFRHLGDNAITEAYAFLFQHLVEDPEWLARRLGIADAEPIAAHARAQRLVYLRRYAAKLAYELELHSSDEAAALGTLAERYSELLGDALRIPWPRETFLSDVDPGFYCACYLRAWALETHLRAHLRERFGTAWFEQPAAGDALRALWRDGQRLSPEELLCELTGAELDFRAVLEDLRL
jgi:hypothetical protein